MVVGVAQYLPNTDKGKGLIPSFSKPKINKKRGENPPKHQNKTTKAEPKFD